MKFKVGDRVICVKNRVFMSRDCFPKVIGNTGIIHSIDSCDDDGLTYQILFDKCCVTGKYITSSWYWCREDQIKSINKLKLKKLLKG